MQQGSGAALDNGDYVARNGGGLNTYYSYFVEVPAGQSRLVIDLFDADIGLGGAAEAGANRDRSRGGGFNTAATYSVRDPSGTVRNVAFTAGDATQPTGADNAWLTLLNATGNSVRDNFGTASYSNNDGTSNWTGAWIETDAGGAGPTTGAIQIVGGELRIQDNVAGTPSIEREADLLGSPGLNLGLAFLSFDYRTSGNLEGTDQISVQVSGNGGGAWTTLETFTDDSTGSRTYNITNFIANNTRVRFIVAGEYNGGTEFFFVDNLRIEDSGTVTAGHWEVRVDMSSAVTAGDDINALGVRAHDGDATSTGTEFNVYFDSFVATGTNDETLNGRTYTFYPWVTAGCSVQSDNFDGDSLGTYSNTSRSGSFSAAATTSGNGTWTATSHTGFVDHDDAVDYGVWTLTHVADTNAANGANYYTAYSANGTTVAGPPPTTQPQASAFRTYFPTDAGTKPPKPYLGQTLRARPGFNNPPVVGTASQYNVFVSVTNPTAFAITFSATNLVTANVPAAAGGGTTTYQGFATVSQGTITAQPAVGGTGNVTWNPGTVAAGATAWLNYRVAITPTAAATNINATGTATSGNGTRATYVDETGNTTQARATITLGGLCQLFTATNVTTPATIEPPRATRTRTGLLLEWETSAEDSVAGFRVERGEADGSWAPVHDGLLFPANSVAGGRYALRDDLAGDEGGVYRILEVTASGATRPHGPYFVRPEPPGKDTVVPSDGFASVPHAPAPAPVEATEASAPGLAFQLAGAAPTAANVEGRVRTTAVGFHRVTAASIAGTFGLSEPDARQRIAQGGVEVTQGGQPVSWLADEGGASLRFWAEPTGSLYTSENVFKLRLSKGTPMATEKTSSTRSVLLTSFAEERAVETDAFSAAGLPLSATGDWWFWDFLVVGNATYGKRSYAFDAPGISRGGGQLEVRLQGATSTGVADEHQVAVRLNGAPLGDARFTAIDGDVATFDVPALLESGNVVELEAVPVPGVAYSTSYLDGFTVRYARLFRAVGDTLSFRSTGGTITISGFTSPGIDILRLDNPRQPKRLDGVTVSGGPTTWSATFTAPAGRFAAVASPAVVNGTATSFVPGPTLTSPQIRADWLAIVPAAMKSGADELAARRRSQGLKTYVATFEDVVDQFSSGLVTPEAIQSFVSATSKWQTRPRYVVLIGAGHFDYLQRLGARPNPLPPLMLTGTAGIYPSDNLLADRHKTGVPNAAIGRVPVTNLSELTTWLRKVERYESGAAPNLAITLSDDTEGGADFTTSAERVVASLPPWFDRLPLSLDRSTLPSVRQQLFDAWGRAAMVHFVGHGGIDRLASEGLLMNADVPNLVGTVPVVSALTCYVNRFGIPGFTSLGEALVRQGAATAVWSSSATSANDEATQAGAHVARLAWSGRAPRLGDAVQEALETYASLGGPPAEALFLELFGDPGMLLNHPAAGSAAGGAGE